MARDAQQPGPRPRGHREGRRRRLGSAAELLDACAGTGAFWNSITRLLDGFKLPSAPETGISIDAVPGPRGPVTFRDLNLRRFLVTPAASPEHCDRSWPARPPGTMRSSW